MRDCLNCRHAQWETDKLRLAHGWENSGNCTFPLPQWLLNKIEDDNAPGQFNEIFKNIPERDCPAWEALPDKTPSDVIKHSTLSGANLDARHSDPLADTANSDINSFLRLTVFVNQNGEDDVSIGCEKCGAEVWNGKRKTLIGKKVKVVYRFNTRLQEVEFKEVFHGQEEITGARCRCGGEFIGKTRRLHHA